MSEAGHAGDDGGRPVLLRRLFSPGVNPGELVVEVEDVVSQARDHAGRNLLSDDDGVLCTGGLHGVGAEVTGVVSVAISSQFLKARYPYEISAATMDAAALRAAAPTTPIGSPSAELGSHCTSSGRSVPSGSLMGTTMAIASSGIRPGMNGQVMTRPVLAARWIELESTAT